MGELYDDAPLPIDDDRLERRDGVDYPDPDAPIRRAQ